MTMLLDPPAIPPAATRARPCVTAFPGSGTSLLRATLSPPAPLLAATPAVIALPVTTLPVITLPVATLAGTTIPGTTIPVITLPVTTVRQAVRVALDRTRRMTLLGSVPVLRRLALPWLLPLHLFIVALTADHIRHTPDASLSYSDGTTPRLHRASLGLALLLATGWLGLLYGTVAALMSCDLTTPAALVAAVALVVPVVEMLGLVDFAVRNPEWVMLKRARGGRPDRRTAYILTSLVSTRDGCGSARELMDLTYPQWQAADAVVIGYPASKSLISYYVRMGARRFGSSTTPPAGSGRATGRSVTFDCRRPLRAR